MKTKNQLSTALSGIYLALLIGLAPPLGAQEQLNVTATGVGLGSTTPAADLDIEDIDGNSFSAFRLTRGADSWAVSHTDTGVVTFNQIGTGGQELTIRERNDANGSTLDVQGTVEGTQFINSSSRTLKTDFAPVDAMAILEAIAALPIESWRYKADPASDRHIGPTAEDFQAALGLGDGEHISSVDVQGVLLLAVKALGERLTETQTELDAAEQHITRLREQLERTQVEPGPVREDR